MPGRNLIVGGSSAFVALATVLAACGGGGGTNGEVTPVASPTTTVGLPTETAATSTAIATTGSPDIRQEDLGEEEGLQAFLAEAGGEVDADSISYVDLTGDGLEEAVVPVSSGGEGGDIAVFVFGYAGERIDELLRLIPESGALKAEIADGELAVSEPVFGPGDPLCCPSELRTTVYGWDGSDLVVVREQVDPAEGN